MPFALLVVEVAVREPAPTALLVWQSRDVPEGVERITQELFLIELPKALGELGSMVNEIERFPIRYGLSFFDQKPTFEIRQGKQS